MEEESKNIIDKLKTTLSKPEDMIKEFTYYNPIGVRINNSLMDLNLLEVELHEVITRNVFKGIDYYSILR